MLWYTRKIMHLRRLFIVPFLLAFFMPITSHAALSEQEKAALQSKLDALNAQIDTQKNLLSAKQKESVSLERDVAILDAQIAKSKLEIRARDLSIQGINDNINQKKGQVTKLSSKIEAEKKSLAALIRKTYEADASNLIHLALSDKTISDFFLDIDNFESIQNGLHQTLGVVKETRQSTQEAQEALEDQLDSETQLRQLQALQQKSIQTKEAERKKILADSKGQEKTYEAIIAARQKDAAAIREALFQLSGSSAIPFGQALQYANVASKKTGVRPALILGIITEETNLGQNIGTGNWRTDMHPTRDAPVFQQICAELGLDPDTMPVSKKAWYGWGGAMGPSQFIPSTWVLYKDKVAALTGSNPPSPWNPQDAFMATALLMSENGAITGNAASERLAALRYLAGWKNASNKAYAFYGDDVMSFAAKYQAQIDVLQG
jgi:membrane-bound lytic murein transglycosylase B